FFQAEDGIRDKLVTGVQTCALPIFEALVTFVRSLPFSVWTAFVSRLSAAASQLEIGRLGNSDGDGAFGDIRRRDQAIVSPVKTRSEERRVGKGGRSQWWRGL